MKSANPAVDEWAGQLIVRDELSLDELLCRYEVTVFTLAMHLTSDETAARQVTIEVFLRMTKEARKFAAEPLDSLIHRFTYDASLSALLHKVQEQAGNLTEIHFEEVEELEKLVC